MKNTLKMSLFMPPISPDKGCGNRKKRKKRHADSTADYESRGSVQTNHLQ